MEEKKLNQTPGSTEEKKAELKESKVGHIIDKIFEYMAIAGAVLLFLMACLITVDVIMRYAFNKPFVFTLAVTELGLVLMTCLLAPWLLRQDGFITVDLLVGRFNAVTQKYFDAAASVIGAVAMLVIGAGAWKQTSYLFTTKAIMWNAGGNLKHWLFAAPLNILYFVLAFEFVRRFFRCVQFIKIHHGEKLAQETELEDLGIDMDALRKFSDSESAVVLEEISEEDAATPKSDAETKQDPLNLPNCNADSQHD